MYDLLKFLTCGSVDDGKSTLIGHMLYDAKLLYTDQEQMLELESRLGSRGGKIDYSLLLDGLMAEREQGITIDVAYRYFTTDRRSFIVADAPGHEEYTRNMAVAASFADLAVILVDASHGPLIQTWRHARICALMGIRYFVFAVNKIDLIHYKEDAFKKVERDIRKLAIDLGLRNIKIIPVSATEGDNLTKKSEKTPWYEGVPLLEYLETLEIGKKAEGKGFLLSVQRVCRPDHTFRGFQGEVALGSVSAGDEIMVYPSGETALVKEIFVGDKKKEKAYEGQPVTLKLDREVDISRGCVLTSGRKLVLSDMFNASILWMDEDRLVPGQSFLIKLGNKWIPATVMAVKYKVDIHTGEHLKTEEIFKNEIAVCDFALAERTVIESFGSNELLGRFIIVNRVTNMTSACGVINYSLRRSENLRWQEFDVTREKRILQMGQKPLTIWFTGLSGSGKSTLANALEKKLYLAGVHTMLLDGDNVRMGLNKNLGFTEQDRIENVRRIAEVAKLMNDAGLVVLACCISPYREERENVRRIIGEDYYLEIFVSTPLCECEKRDVKGLYKKARDGQIPNFTGITSPYECPHMPQVELDTSKFSVDECVDKIMDIIKNMGLLFFSA